METAATIPVFTSAQDLAWQFDDNPTSNFGIVIDADHRDIVLAELEQALARSGRLIQHLSARIDEAGLATALDVPETAAGSVSPSTASAWRDHVLAALGDEQQQAAARVAIAKERGETADPFDREVATWLASGLTDLFRDPITGAVFLTPGKGIFARLAEEDLSARFNEEHFLRPEGIRFLEAGRPAQAMLTKLSLLTTNRFRQAAAQIMNRVVDRLLIPNVPFTQRLNERLLERGVTLLLIVDDIQAFEPGTWFELDTPAVRWIVSATDESVLRARFNAAISVVQYQVPAAPVIEEVPAVPVVEEVPPTPVAEQAPAVEPVVAPHASNQPLIDNAIQQLLSKRSKVDTFIQHGLLTPDDFLQQKFADVIDSLRMVSIEDDAAVQAKLAGAAFAREEIDRLLSQGLHQWFERQLAAFDAEGFLGFDEVETLYPTIAAARELLLGGSTGLRLPESDADFAGLQRTIEYLHQLVQGWSVKFAWQGEAGMAFDIAVAMGGAPLDMLTPDVKWWLKKENRDWHKYRIVRVD